MNTFGRLVASLAGFCATLIVAPQRISAGQELLVDPVHPPVLERHRVVVVFHAGQPARARDDTLGWLSFSIASGLEQYAAGRVVTFRSVQRFLHAWVVVERDASSDHLANLAALTRARWAVTGSHAIEGDTVHLTLNVVDLLTGVRERSIAVSAGGPAPMARIIATGVQRLAFTLTGLATPDYATPPVLSRPPPSFAAYRSFDTGLRLVADGRHADALSNLDQAVAIDSTFLAARLEGLFIRWLRYDIAAVDSVLRDLDRREATLVARERIEVDLARAQRADDVEAGLAAARRYVDYVPEDRYPLGLFALRGNYLREALGAFRGGPVGSPFTARSIDHWSQYLRTLHMVGQYDEEREEAARAAALFPSSRGTAWYEVRALIGQRKVGEALRLHREIEPLPDATSDGRIGQWGNTVRELFAHDAQDSAAAVLARLIRAQEALPPERRAAARASMAAHYELAGRWADAQLVVESLLRDTPPGAVWQRKNHMMALGCIAAARGADEAARRWVARLDSLRATVPDQLRVTIGAAIDVAQGTVLGCLGEREGALVLLERGMRTPGAPGYGFGYGFGPWLHRNVFYEKLRGFEPFERLMRPRN